MMARIAYLRQVLTSYVNNSDTRCPHCDSKATTVIGHKYLLLQLRHCTQCGLQFRFPKDTVKINQDFYSGQYQQENGITTHLPTTDELEGMLANAFANTDRDFAERIKILKTFQPTGEVLDYGASWGYGTWQIRRAGFDVTGFEIDVDRARYGRDRLGLEIYTDWNEIRNSESVYDVLFTSHVLEHLPHLQTTFSDFNRVLKPGGVLFIMVPNCTGMGSADVFAKKKSFAFGEKHTMAYSADFFQQNLPKYGFNIDQIDVTPYKEPKPNLVDGTELLVVASKAG